jgi:biotin transport system substrate-specific component
MKTKQLVIAALFVALIAIGALVKIPLGPVPFTLQLPMVILTGLLLGPKLAFISLITYTLLGLLGIPIFAGASGLGAFVSPTFGFIIGYIPAALIIGVGKNKSIAKMVMWTMFGMSLVFICGTIYFYFIMEIVVKSPMSISEVLMAAVIPFLLKDIILAVLTVLFVKTLNQRGLILVDS